MLVTESGIMILVNEEQPQKALSPIVVTELGIVMLANEKQSKKALSSIFVTESGIMIPVNEEQPEYLQPIITQYFIGNKSEIWSLSLIVHSKG